MTEKKHEGPKTSINPKTSEHDTRITAPRTNTAQKKKNRTEYREEHHPQGTTKPSFKVLVALALKGQYA